MSRYVDIKIEEFEELMNEFRLGLVPSKNSQEYVYGGTIFDDDRFAIKIFSSIHKNNNVSRNVGKDAIKIVAIYYDDNNRAWVVSKFKKIYRTKNWAFNLRTRIINIKYSFVGNPCNKCGAGMIIRGGRNGYFYGCVKFSKGKCSNTSNLNDKRKVDLIDEYFKPYKKTTSIAERITRTVKRRT